MEGVTQEQVKGVTQKFSNLQVDPDFEESLNLELDDFESEFSENKESVGIASRLRHILGLVSSLRHILESQKATIKHQKETMRNISSELLQLSLNIERQEDEEYDLYKHHRDVISHLKGTYCANAAEELIALSKRINRIFE